VTAGTTYTVAFTSTAAGIQFDDLEHGRSTTLSGLSSTSGLGATDSPFAWVPAKTGVNRIGIYALSNFLPAAYSFTISTH
jgi:hypothetical protein